MWPHTPRRVLKFALPTIAALGAGAAVGVAAIPSDGSFNACVLKTAQAPLPKGAVRIIDPATEQCTADETPVQWNQQGQAGPPGPQGDPGPAGLDAVGSGDTSSSDSSSSSSNDTFSTPTQAGGPSADMFLKLDGIAGDSTDDKHKGEIDVTSFGFSLGRGRDGTGSGGRTPTGVSASARGTKSGLQTLRIDKVYDSSSPKLFRAAATGQHIKSAVLSFRRSNDSGDLEFLTYTLSDVQVTSYDQGGKDGDARDLGSLEEEVGLTAAKIHVTERAPSSDNSDQPGPPVSADWTVPKRAG